MESNNQSRNEKADSISSSRLLERVRTAFLTVLYNLDGKPEPVVLAVNLVWASLLVRLLQFSLMSNAGSPLAFSFSILIVFGPFAFLNLKVRSGRNWARWLLLVISILDVLGLGGHVLLNGISGSQGSLLYWAIGPLLQLYALRLLFTRPGSTWFQNVTPDS